MTERSGVKHTYLSARCADCSWGRSTDPRGRTPTDLREEAIAHIRETGHHVSLTEFGGARLHADPADS